LQPLISKCFPLPPNSLDAVFLLKIIPSKILYLYTGFRCKSLHSDEGISIRFWFNSSQFQKLISIAGYFQKLTIPCGLELQVIFGEYRKHIHFANAKPVECVKVQDFFCLKFSSVLSKGDYNYIFLTKFKNQIMSNNYSLSWNRASMICRELGGHLPYFENREVLDEFLALIKFSDGLPLIHSLFIGLQLNNINKVCPETSIIDVP